MDITTYLNLLIVDDEPVIGELIQEMTKEHFKQVFVATNPLEGKEILTKHSIDVVTTDLKMPNGGGVELIRYIKEVIDETIPCIIITAFPDMNSACNAIRYGAFDYLTKPFNESTLITMLKRAADKRVYEVEKERLFIRSLAEISHNPQWRYEPNILKKEQNEDIRQSIEMILTQRIAENLKVG